MRSDEFNFLRGALRSSNLIRDNARGFAPVFAALILLAAIQWRFDYIRTENDKADAGLDTGRLYLLDRSYVPCVGDVARYHSRITKFRKLGRIAAYPGTDLTVTSDGYVMFGIAHRKSAAWVKRAMKQLGHAGTSVSVPAGHVLIINSKFAARPERDDWAYEVLPVSKIDGTLTRVLLARDLSEIGKRITAQPQACTPLQSSVEI